MAKIQDEDKYYYLLRIYVDRMFKSAYHRVEYHGKEKIPKEGTIIYAPNHTSTVMDALAVLAIDRPAKVFVARADAFKLPLVLKILTFLKMLPINRKRDGIQSLTKNEEITSIVIDVLRDRVPFCILPEGTHRTKYGLLPLQKGLFRIALQANAEFGNETPVYIVPIGITYGHFFRYRSSLLVQVGDPIHVTRFVKDTPQLTVPEQINHLRDDLVSKLKDVVLYIPDDEHYDAILALCQLYGNEQQTKSGRKRHRQIDNFTASKQVIAEAVALLESKPEEMHALFDTVRAFSSQRHDLNIGLKSILKSHIGWAALREAVLLAIGCPFFFLSFGANALILLATAWACSQFKDKAFLNLVRYLVSFVMLPLFLIVGGVLTGILYSWIAGIVVAIAFIPSFFFLHDYLRLVRIFISDIKWIFHRKLHKDFQQIKADWKIITENSR
jgi:1-acyl-sn-glycerol-3-phosphate acyltransferase